MSPQGGKRSSDGSPSPAAFEGHDVTRLQGASRKEGLDAADSCSVQLALDCPHRPSAERGCIKVRLAVLVGQVAKCPKLSFREKRKTRDIPTGHQNAPGLSVLGGLWKPGQRMLRFLELPSLDVPARHRTQNCPINI